MKLAEFDVFADEYYEQHRSNVAITGENPEYFSEYKIKLLSQFARTLQTGEPSVLDFGSGIGNSIPFIGRYLPASQLTCADVSQRSLSIAETRFPGLARSLRIEGDRIPAADDSFDMTFSACVFHHIPHEEHVHWLTELRRVARPGGMVVIFEHNPLNPLTVRAVNTCPFDVNARLIRAGAFAESYRCAGWSQPQVSYHLFFPRALSRLRFLEPSLARVVLGAQYSIAAVKAG